MTIEAQTSDANDIRSFLLEVRATEAHDDGGPASAKAEFKLADNDVEQLVMHMAPNIVAITGSVTASGDMLVAGNYSGSVNTNFFGDEFNAHGADANSGFTLVALGNKPQLFASSGRVNIGNDVDNSDILVNNHITASGDITASGVISGLSWS